MKREHDVLPFYVDFKIRVSDKIDSVIGRITNTKTDNKQNEDIPNETTLAAFKEVEEMEKNPNGVKRYKSADELIEDLNKE